MNGDTIHSLICQPKNQLNNNAPPTDSPAEQAAT